MGKPLHLLQDREKILLENARPLIYSRLDSGEVLRIHSYIPKDIKEGEKRPVFLFFNGGAWDRGSVSQFAPHALNLVERGAVCGLVQYRDKREFPDSTPLDAFADCRLAIQFVRHHAERMRIDPDKVIAVGAAAGANMAASAALSKSRKKVKPGDDEITALSCKPNGLILFSPIIDVYKDRYGYDQFGPDISTKLACLSKRIERKLPPTLILHGTEDRLIPFEDVFEFVQKLEKIKAPCKLVEFEGRDHSFFNMNFDPISYEACLIEIDAFLEEYKFLEMPRDDPQDPRLISWREYDY
ncbi:MAG: alpha/beta hydrolase [Verrucomicrobiales bacterium]|nr:alpha/beta hydrolase [Verrucomicrobiales bacterium]